MKIAIQGHPFRGKEVIQILKSLGGINTWNYLGDNFDCYYEIHGNTIICACTKSDTYKYYTLEEFEKEFPFKIGTKVIVLDYSNKKGTIINIKPCGPILSYLIKLETGNGVYRTTKSLKPYKEMKEERNITLTLDKAKEWYKKGGELKEIALQAFTEKELNPLPRSWKEFCKNYPKAIGEAFVDTLSIIFCNDEDGSKRNISSDRNFCPSKKSAEAHLAMIQLEQLRDCYNNNSEAWGWSYSIIKRNGIPELVRGCDHDTFLRCNNETVAKEFLKCFRILIEKAGDLI